VNALIFSLKLECATPISVRNGAVSLQMQWQFAHRGTSRGTNNRSGGGDRTQCRRTCTVFSHKNTYILVLLYSYTCNYLVPWPLRLRQQSSQISRHEQSSQSLNITAVPKDNN